MVSRAVSCEGYTEDVNLYHHKLQAVCKHCRKLMNHHMKSESAKVHLNKYAPFCKLMNDMEEDERPACNTTNKNLRKALSTAVLVSVSSLTPRFSRQLSIKTYAISVASEQQKVGFQKHIAIPCSAIESSLQQVEDVHLIAAIKRLHPDDGFLSSERQLDTSALNAYHADVKEEVAKGMNGTTFCLISDGWLNIRKNESINNMVASSELNLFLASVLREQQEKNQKFIVENIKRVICKRPFTLFAGVVTNNTSTNKKA